MRLHNGTFDIANAPGGGTVVTMTLPMENKF
jgi:signal transduction histidine kinase